MISPCCARRVAASRSSHDSWHASLPRRRFPKYNEEGRSCFRMRTAPAAFVGANPSAVMLDRELAEMVVGLEVEQLVCRQQSPRVKARAVADVSNLSDLV